MWLHFGQNDRYAAEQHTLPLHFSLMAAAICADNHHKVVSGFLKSIANAEVSNLAKAQQSQHEISDSIMSGSKSTGQCVVELVELSVNKAARHSRRAPFSESDREFLRVTVCSFGGWRSNLTFS
jgi:hypothetical protein